MTHAADTLSLLADLGGTNTRVCLANGMNLRADSIRHYKNAAHDGLAPILSAYLAEMGHPPVTGACVDLAGPVDGDVGQMTNLKWVISGPEIARATGAGTVAVLNDLQAMGQAMGHIAPADLTAVLDGPVRPGAAQLVVNVGTGFNAVLVADTAAGRIVPAAEAGHVSLPVGSPEEWELAQALVADHGHASVEEILSGRGLAWLYAHYARAAGRTGEMPGSVAIMAAIAAGDDPVAERTAAMFLRLLGRATGDLALTHLPFGGIWFVGGLANAFAPHMAAAGRGREFRHGFRDKGRFGPFMDQFRGTVVTDGIAALRGCAAYLQALRQR